MGCWPFLRAEQRADTPNRHPAPTQRQKEPRSGPPGSTLSTPPRPGHAVAGDPPLNSTVTDVLQGLAGIIGMGLMFLAPGYCAASLTDIASFRRRSSAEKLLWSVALSIPLAVAICALAGRLTSTAGLNVLFAVTNASALALLARSRRKVSTTSPRFFEPSTCKMLALMALFGVYCILATTDFQLGHGLYVSTITPDWSVRVQMVRAAMRSAAVGHAVPPINGLTTLTGGVFGHAPHMRYYYFWYIAVAQAARTLGIDAHAALVASCAWAGWALIAAAFLALKYMLRPGPKLRRYCFLLLLVGAVLGLDILPTALTWVSPHLHPYSEMEWWHQDRTPSFLGSVLYAPHHMAGFSSLLIGFLLLLVSVRRDDDGTEKPSHPVAASVLAGITFAAAAGTALFPTFLYVFVLGFWAFDLLRRRQFAVAGALAGAGVLAVLLAHPYLRELSTGSSAASGFASLRWRNDSFVAGYQARIHALSNLSNTVSILIRQPLVLVLDFFDLGFYTLVLGHGFRRWRQSARWTAGQCALASLIAGAAIPALFLSSTATSGPNDLGVDAGFLLRFGLQIAAVPWVWGWYQRWQANRLRDLGTWQRASVAFGALLFALGLAAQLYQIPDERFYYALLGDSRLHKQIDTFTKDRLAERLYNVRSAYAAMNKLIPPTALDDNAVQFNPIGTMRPAETLYTNHQIASWDMGCGTSYGGDYASCAPAIANLLFLYGNTRAGVDKGRADNDRQDGAAPRAATLADFEQTCHTLHLRAIVAESTDPIWRKLESWVWSAPLLTGNGTVRILACPAN